MNPPNKPRIVRCPGCGGPSEYGPGNAFRPFCSGRCKNHDFGAWATESYRVGKAGDPSPDDADGDLPPHQ